MATARKRDLSEEQAAILRPIVERLCEGRGALSRLAEATQLGHANILAFRRGEQGLSYATALKICELADEDAFTLLGLPRPARLRALDMPADQFLMRLAIAPRLSETLTAHPRRWSLSTVVQALQTPHPTDEEGVPIGGWAARLDAIRGPVSDGAMPTAGTRRQSRAKKPGPAPK